MFESKRLIMVKALETDIPLIMEMENHKDNRLFIWQGSYEEHLREIEDPRHLLLIIKLKEVHLPIGYLLIRLDEHSHIFELRRIVIAEKARGYGKETMIAVIHFAFEKLGTNRFWLDVYPDNHIGISLYEKLKLHRDGVLRQNYLAERGYMDQIIYSLLKSEYDAWKKEFVGEESL